MINSRCDECGSPVRSNHDGNIMCTRDESHGRGVAFGGAGSGWSAAGGHTPGSQGGHAEASRTHTAAASAHEAAAGRIEKSGFQSGPGSLGGARGGSEGETTSSRTAVLQATKNAATASREVGSSKLYEAQAASAYAKMARNATDPKQAAQYHRQAAQYHRGAAHAHNVFAGEKK